MINHSNVVFIFINFRDTLPRPKAQLVRSNEVNHAG